MRNKRLMGCILIVLWLLLALLENGYAAGQTLPDVKPEMLSADYWIQKLPDPDRVLLTPDQIAAFNAMMAAKQSDAVKDLTQYPDSIAKEQLLAWIGKAKKPSDPIYFRGKPVSSWFFYWLNYQLNLGAVQKENPVRYGFAVRHTEIRAFPTPDRVFDSPTDIEFDDYQGSAMDPGEPVLLLHQSRNRKWLFIQSYNVRGWVMADDIAATSTKEEWSSYLNASRFLIVTGDPVFLNPNPFNSEVSELRFTMGAKIPLADDGEMPDTIGNQAVYANYVVKVPVRDAKGRLNFQLALLPRNAAVQEGYLPYTRANVLRQAFKLLGRRYGWGGMFNSMDCSAFVLNIYRTFGFQFPRNTGDLKNIPGKTVPFKAATFTDFNQQLDQLQPGSTLNFPGHILLFLGKDHGEPYAIHDLAAYVNPEIKTKEGAFLRMNVNEVVVSTLKLTRASGKKHWECLESGIQIGE